MLTQPLILPVFGAFLSSTAVQHVPFTVLPPLSPRPSSCSRAVHYDVIPGHPPSLEGLTPAIWQNSTSSFPLSFPVSGASLAEQQYRLVSFHLRFQSRHPPSNSTAVKFALSMSLPSSLGSLPPTVQHLFFPSLLSSPPPALQNLNPNILLFAFHCFFMPKLAPFPVTQQTLHRDPTSAAPRIPRFRSNGAFLSVVPKYCLPVNQPHHP